MVPSRRRTSLEDDWTIGGAKSLLGVALLVQARYDEAEAVLLEARRDLETSQSSRSHELKTTISRLIDLYVAQGKPQMAATYRVLLGS